MEQLAQEDKLLLEIIQKDFPLEERIYKNFADELRTTESQVILRINELFNEGIIRDISAFINMTKIGFKSTLVALNAGSDVLEYAIARINSHPGVSHNYMRNHDYNLWFTLTIGEKLDFKAEIDAILPGLPRVRYLLLPSLQVYKIGVNFRFLKKPPNEEARPEVKPQVKAEKPIETSSDPIELSSMQKKVTVSLSSRFPVTPFPYKSLADELRITSNELLDTIRVLKASGVIKRIGASIRHRKAGFVENAMVCFRLPDSRIGRAGRILAGFPEVSHCYRRPVYPDWPYPLFAMVHSQTREDCEGIIARMASSIGTSDFIALYSTRELKKEKIKLQGLLHER